MARTQQNIDTIKQKLFNPKTDKKQFLSALKTSNYDDFKKNIKKAYGHPFTKKYIKGSLLPKSYKDIRNVKPPYFSNNLEGELAWLAESITDELTLLNDFIHLENKLQNKILFGDFEQASHVLKEINENICCSFWALEINYFIIDNLEGTEGNWKKKNEINEQLTNRFSIFLNQVFSKKAEKGFSSKDYHRSLYNEIRNSSEFDFQYLNFRLANHLLPQYELITFFAYVDSSSSLIDRYLSLIKIINELLSTDYESNCSFIRKLILDNFSEVKDSRLNRILEFLGEQECPDYSDHPFQLILENYSISNYNFCINRIPEILDSKPSSVELWDIFVKSLIESDQDFIPTKVSSFLDDILKILYNIYKLNGSIEDKSDQILKLIVSLPNFKFSNQLLNLLHFSKDINSTGFKRALNYCINSNYFNPIITTLSKDEIKFENLTFPKTVECLEFIHGKGEEKNIDTNNFKSTVYSIRRLFSKDNFKELLEYSKSEYLNLRENIYTEEITLMFFISYLKLNKIEEAIDLYVNSYFKNKNLLSRVNADLLVEKIIESDYNVNTTQNLAILLILEDLDYYYQFVGIEMWLNTLGVELPSKISIDNCTDRAKIVFLLFNGCRIEVLEKFYYQYESRDDVIEERKNILKNLIKAESENYDRFIDELSSIVQKQKVQSVLSEVNSGRIRLSSEMIAYEENNFQNTYDRYKLISDFSSYNDLTLYDGKELLKDFFQNLSENKFESLDPAFYTFRTLVNEMIDSFLFNKKNGLDGDLSTRIRHGELENQLRSIFDRNHLISKKNDHDLYENVSYWDSQLIGRMDETLLEELQSKIKNFSERIDNNIQFLVRQQIQVYSENYMHNKYGFFNYSFNDSYWNLIHKESLQIVNSYHEFREYIYSILKLHTEHILQELRKYFVKNLQEELNKELDNLNSEILDCINQSDCSELFQNIIDAKRDLQNEISDLTEWFIISDSTIDKSMDIKTLLRTSFESHNIKHPNAIIVPEIEADDMVYLYNYKHFIYIILNLLDNVRSHSKLYINELKVSTKANYYPDEQVLEFSIKNNINPILVQKDVLVQKLLKIKENWNKDVNRESVNLEGGTGFEKIKKILVYDIKSKNHDFKFQIEDDFLEIGFRINITHNFLIDGN